MNDAEKVSFFSKGKRVVFKVATKGARRASAYAQRQVGYKATPAQRKAAAARAEKQQYKPYKTPAQRKAATKDRTVRRKTNKTDDIMYARCPICRRPHGAKTTAEMNAWIVAHVKRYHSK